MWFNLVKKALYTDFLRRSNLRKCIFGDAVGTFDLKNTLFFANILF